MITLTKLTGADKLLRSVGSKIEFLSQVFPRIIGEKGRTKLKVEEDTGATVTVPSKNSTAPWDHQECSCDRAGPNS